MANKLIFDENKMLAVAKIVRRCNKYMHGDSPQNIVAMMKRVAFETFHTETQGYVATGGFVLSAYNTALRGSDEGIYIYPSISDIILDKGKG